jgi:hypothetical protein
MFVPVCVFCAAGRGWHGAVPYSGATAARTGGTAFFVLRVIVMV